MEKQKVISPFTFILDNYLEVKTMAYNADTKQFEGFIYKIYNDVNSKVYIGQTRTSIKQRWKQHRVDMKRSNSPLYRAMLKYGVDKFHIKEIVRYTSPTKSDLITELNNAEQYYIAKYKSLASQNGYNLESGGNNHDSHCKVVKQYDLKLNYIQSFKNINIASNITGVDENAIRTNCEHYQQTGGCYIWCYDDDIPVKPKYISDTSYDISRLDLSNISGENILKLMISGWDGRRIIQYNVFGEVINIFDNPIIASEKLHIEYAKLKKYLSKRELYFDNTILRYENESFTEKDLSDEIRPISMYDMNGNFQMRFVNKTEADKYLGLCEGSISKAIKRGGSCKGHLFSYYGKQINRKVRCREIPVEMLDSDNNVIKTFDYMSLIANYFNLSDCYKQIRKAIKNKSLYKGYYWRYKDEFAIV